MTQQEKQQRNFYSVIPATVRYDDDIPANAKLLYGEITSLCNEKGYCWASNEYFADLYGVSKKSISRWISLLIQKGYLVSEVIYKEGTKEIIERRLKLGNTLWTKMSIPYGQNCPYPMDKNVYDNNKELIINNNKKENIEKKKINFVPPTLEEVDEYIRVKNMNIDAKTFIDYFEANDWKDSKGNKVKSWKQKLITWNNFNNKKQVKTKQQLNDEVLERFIKDE